MKKSTEIVAEKDNNIWSWLLRASSALFAESSSRALPDKTSTTTVLISLRLFFKLADPLAREIMSYFPLSERRALLAFKPQRRLSDLNASKPRNQLFLFQKGLHDELHVEHATDLFIHYMTLTGPENQSKALAMLTHYPQLASKLISKQRTMNENAAARQFSQPISAYEYAWCIDDAAMCRMLEEHMSDSIKTKVLQQCEARAVEKFMYLIAREGEDNQNKAEAMLKQYPYLVRKLISLKIDTRDLVRHFIQPMSAYEYAYWSGDTRMRTMLNQYVFKEEALQSIVYEQCNHIAEHGIEFEMLSKDGKPVPNSTVSHSTHYDYQPLKAAYRAFETEVTRLNTNNTEDAKDWMYAESLWLKVGLVWATAPVSGLQEICSPHSFLPLQAYQATLTNPSIVRTLKVRTLNIDDWEVDGEDYLASRGLINANFYHGISIYKRLVEQGCYCGWAAPRVGARSNAVAVDAIGKARTGVDLKQTLVDLRPPELKSRLSL